MGWPKQSSLPKRVCDPRYVADPTSHRCCDFHRVRWLSAFWNAGEISNTEINATESFSLPGSGFSVPLLTQMGHPERERGGQDKQAMNAQIVRRLSPEEEELAKKRDELVLLQAELAERELFLANLRAELTAFEGRYLREVGVLYAELDDWKAKIAQMVAEDEGTVEARSAATEARTQAEESYSAAHGEAARATEFTPSPELKKLYRDVAKRVHPDLATDEADRAHRERSMAEANRAYQQSDIDALRRILEEYESSPESVQGTGVAADLVRVIRQIRQLHTRLVQIELEIVSLGASDIAKLKIKAEEVSDQGRNLLAEMARDVKRRIDNESRRFETLSAKKRGQ